MKGISLKSLHCRKTQLPGLHGYPFSRPFYKPHTYYLCFKNTWVLKGMRTCDTEGSALSHLLLFWEKVKWGETYTQMYLLNILCSFTSFYSALDTTEAVRQRTLAREEGRPCSLLSQLWPAVPSTAGVWRNEQRGKATRRCLDPWCRERELEKGENIHVLSEYSLPYGHVL